ncbi:hypothetical protein [Curtobacterium flaccumfaciens]|uniref:hypothetical protein n=1 Tax=Curtobacterium flaccumfaciens TaxID=2035 RepID=UPI00387A3C6C
MAHPDTLHLGNFRPPVSLIRETIEAFQREVTEGSKRYIASRKIEMTSPEFRDEFGLYDHYRTLDTDTYEAPPPNAALVMAVNNREREHAGLENCLNLLQSEPWSHASLVISTEEIIEVADDTGIWGYEFSLRFDLEEGDGKALTDFPSEESRARILAPLTEAANEFWRKNPKARTVKPKEERKAFNFNEDVLKHPLVVNAFSGVIGAVIGFVGGLIVASLN